MGDVTISQIKQNILDLDASMQAIVEMLDRLDGDTVIIDSGIEECTPFLDNGIPLAKGCAGQIAIFDRSVTVQVLSHTLSRIQGWLCDVRQVIDTAEEDMALPPGPEMT